MRRHELVEKKNKKVIARYETSKGGTWYELYEEDFRGKPSYSYSSDSGGGNYGSLSSPEEAISKLDKYIREYVQPDMKSIKRIK